MIAAVTKARNIICFVSLPDFHFSYFFLRITPENFVGLKLVLAFEYVCTLLTKPLDCRIVSVVCLCYLWNTRLWATNSKIREHDQTCLSLGSGFSDPKISRVSKFEGITSSQRQQPILADSSP